MEIVLANHDTSESFYVLSMGYEDISENAHWGRGLRNKCILHYVISGEGFFDSVKVKCGEGFLITPGCFHEYHSSEEKPWRYFWIVFDGEGALNITKKYVATDEDGIFKFSLSSEFTSLVESAISELGPISQEKALGYFYFFISHLGGKIARFENRYVEEAKRYMSVNFSRQLSITELASAVGINDRYLYNLFMKFEGVSPKKYLSAWKLSRAELMLKSTRLTISEIAEQCGFSDVLAFSRFFSKKNGISPREYYK